MFLWHYRFITKVGFEFRILKIFLFLNFKIEIHFGDWVAARNFKIWTRNFQFSHRKIFVRVIIRRFSIYFSFEQTFLITFIFFKFLHKFFHFWVPLWSNWRNRTKILQALIILICSHVLSRFYFGNVGMCCNNICLMIDNSGRDSNLVLFLLLNNIGVAENFGEATLRSRLRLFLNLPTLQLLNRYKINLIWVTFFL